MSAYSRDVSKHLVIPRGTSRPVRLNRLLASVLATQIFDVRAYGARADGSTDDSSAINAAIDAAATAGGGLVILARATHAVASTIDLSGKHQVQLLGWGSGGESVAEGGTPGTKLLWTGSTSTSNIVVKIDYANIQKTISPEIHRVCIDCAQKAGIGLRCYSSDGAIIDDIWVLGYTNIAYDIGVNTTEDDNGGAAHNMAWSNIRCDVINGAATTPIAMQLDGTPTANTNFNNFQLLTFLHRASKGIVFKNSDNNYMWNVRCEGSGDACEFQGGANTNEAARANIIELLSTDGAIISRGTASFAAAAYDNNIFIDNHNPTPLPTVETGSYLHWSSNRGYRVIHGGHPDLRLIGTEGFSRIALQDTFGSASGTQAINMRMSSNLFVFQQLGDDLSFVRTLYTVAPGAGVGTLTLNNLNLDMSTNDLSFSTGGVISWNSNDVSITHSANLLAFAGASSGYTFDMLLTLGHTANLAIGGNADNLEVIGSTASTGAMALAMFNATAGTGAHFDFYRSKNASIGSATVVASGDNLGSINWFGAQQTGTFATQTMAAQIRAEVDGTVTSGSGGDMPGRIVFATTADAGGAVTDRLTLDSAGVLKPATNDGVPLGTVSLSFADLFLALGGVVNWNSGDVTITHSANALAFAGASNGYSFDALVDISGAAAGQIKFPATQNASADANTLDDYEEGSWTPAASFATPGDSSIVLSQAVGRYVKIGAMVTLWAQVTTSTFTHTTASGNFQVTGLPFAAENVTDLTWRGLVRWQGITKVGYTQVNASIAGGGTTMTFAASGSGVSASGIVAADMPTGGTVNFSIEIQYRAA